MTLKMLRVLDRLTTDIMMVLRWVISSELLPPSIHDFRALLDDSRSEAYCCADDRRMALLSGQTGLFNRSCTFSLILLCRDYFRFAIEALFFDSVVICCVVLASFSVKVQVFTIILLLYILYGFID